MRSRVLSYLLVLTLTLPWAISASAQAPTPTPQFAFTGFIQAATLDTSGAICRSEEHTSELQSRSDLVCRLLLEKKKKKHNHHHISELASRLQLQQQLRHHLLIH